MIYVTGDCHGEFSKLSYSNFPEQKELTAEDFVIICGDFGAVWNAGKQSSEEKFWMSFLSESPFTTLFVDGNHENYDRLNSEFETVEFHGGMTHKLGEKIYHLKRGEIFELQGRRFLAFGGASCHDIKDGVLFPEKFKTKKEFNETARLMRKRKKDFRISRLNWWEEELPSDEEYRNAEQHLAKAGYCVDYVISHCAPQFIVDLIDPIKYPSDRLTLYFDELSKKLKFRNWFFGHYHEDRKITDKFILLCDQVVKIPQ